MKARKLRKILNNPKYHIHQSRGKICIGSHMCNDLLTLDIKTNNVKYALDTFGDGRKALGNETLEFIWDKFYELIGTDELKDIIEGCDEIEKKLPLFYYEDGAIIETHTDEYGYGNVTHDGVLIYENSHYETFEKALDEAIKSREYSCEYMEESYLRQEQELLEYKKKVDLQKSYLQMYKNLKSVSV